MTAPSYNPTAVVWQHDGQYEYDTYSTLLAAQRKAVYYQDGLDAEELTDWFLAPTVLLRDVTEGLVVLDHQGDRFRVTRVDDTWGGPENRTVHGQVWECGRLSGWCAGTGHQIIAPTLSMFPVVPDPALTGQVRDVPNMPPIYVPPGVPGPLQIAGNSGLPRPLYSPTTTTQGATRA